MAQLRYPIGIQTFSEIITEGYAYVDKTAFVAKLVNDGKFYFLSRPRRFGKSLLLSTLHAYFDGKRELFKGLALDSDDVDWRPTPVLHFDFNSENYGDPDGLPNILNRYLGDYESQYGIDNSVSPETIAGRFARLLKTVLLQTGCKAAILVDEYDKPLLGLEEDSEQFKKNQAILKGFFGNLKSMDGCIRFAMLTGVARFSKVSIFSDLNNLDDISLSEEYADICGWSEQELVDSFRPGIEALAEARKEDFSTTLDTLREYYDGYLFHERGQRLYNPFSVLRALKSREIEPYWFETGTPAFLAKRVRNGGISLPDIGRLHFKNSELQSVSSVSNGPIALMFQTGYLTIESYDPAWGYKLRFPNREVETGFAECLYPLYVPAGADGLPFSANSFKRDLYDGDPEAFMERMRTLIKEQPYHLRNEGNFQNIAWNVCLLSGATAYVEIHSYKGRSDLDVLTPGQIYVFEFKCNQSAEAAMAQLHERDYAGRYALDPRPVYLIGANFSTKKPDAGLTGWLVERLK